MATLIDAPPDGALAAAKAYLRIESDDENALLGTLIAAALAVAEAFTGLAPFTTAWTAILAATPGVWQRLPATPVTAIGAVAALAIDGTATPLDPARFETDIGAAGDGWVRVLDAGDAGRVTVGFTAGIAGGWADLPAPLRQGVVRLVAHLHANRDAADEGAPPAAIAALWRPFRRMRLTGERS